MLETLVIEPDQPAQRTVIWLHGLGADGHDFEPLISEWGLVEELGIRFVLPHAPRRPVTLNRGMVMRAWYDIYDLGFENGEDVEGIQAASADIRELIQIEGARGTGPGNIILAGFSQGGALALHVALRSDVDLAGVLALSCYLPLADSLGDEIRDESKNLAIRMDHGVSDQVVPIYAARRACRLLEEQGRTVDFHEYSMGHSLCPQQIESLRGWFVDRFT